MNDMRIIVLVKQVPDPNLVSISESGHLQRENVPSMTDPFGMMALQHALRFKREIGAHITVVSMGPPQAETMLRRCLEYGADDAILLSDRSFAGSDTIATARTLGCFLKGQDYDVIFCGMQATDGDTAQMPPELSSVLGVHIYSYVGDVRLEDDIIMTQMYERESVDVVLSTPAVVTFIRPPMDSVMLPSMVDFISARKKTITVMGAWMVGIPPNVTGTKGSRTRVERIRTVVKDRKDTEFVDGSDSASVADLLISEATI